MATSEPRSGPILQNSLFISLLAVRVLNSSSQTDLDQRPALKGAARPYRHCLICDGLETRSTGVNFLYFVGLAADFDGTIANHGFVNVDAAT
jgi:hypothetical protein